MKLPAASPLLPFLFLYAALCALLTSCWSAYRIIATYTRKFDPQTCPVYLCGLPIPSTPEERRNLVIGLTVFAALCILSTFHKG